MTTFSGAPHLFGSPKGGEDKPDYRLASYPTYRCTECQLLRVYAPNAICTECFDNKHPLKP